MRESIRLCDLTQRKNRTPILLYLLTTHDDDDARGKSRKGVFFFSDEEKNSNLICDSYSLFFFLLPFLGDWGTFSTNQNAASIPKLGFQFENK